jgi:carboxyl-terminal processing protease
MYRQLDLFATVFERIRSDYVEEVDDRQLIESAINGMLASLDPHSSYLSQESFQDMQVQTKGSFGGLGIEVTLENGLVKVVSPIDDTPAYRAGIRASDLITKLDGEQVLGMTLNDAVERMRGPIGSNVTLTIQRGTQEHFNVCLTRDIIHIESVRWQIASNNIGYIRITSFTEQTDSGVRRAVEGIKKQVGNRLIGYVLDLRNNPGGLLDQAVIVSDIFLDHGEIVSTRGRIAANAQRYNARSGDLTRGRPIVVLINGGSASASEIVAGALQDHHRAIIMGTRSFGKGSVQTIIPLAGRGAIRLTTARYYTPSGRSIQTLGIIPDIEVQLAQTQEISASGQYEIDLRGALRNDQASHEDIQQGHSIRENLWQTLSPLKGTLPTSSSANSSVESTLNTISTAPSNNNSKDDQLFDYQLARAFDLLRGVALFSQHSRNSSMVSRMGCIFR